MSKATRYNAKALQHSSPKICCWLWINCKRWWQYGQMQFARKHIYYAQSLCNITNNARCLLRTCASLLTIEIAKMILVMSACHQISLPGTWSNIKWFAVFCRRFTQSTQQVCCWPSHNKLGQGFEHQGITSLFRTHYWGWQWRTLKNLVPATGANFLCQKFNASSHKLLVQETKPAQQTRLTISTIDDASRKHNWPFKQYYYCHLHASFFCSVQCKKTCTRKKHVQESMTHTQETCASLWYKILGRAAGSICRLMGTLVFGTLPIKYQEPKLINKYRSFMH